MTPTAPTTTFQGKLTHYASLFSGKDDVSYSVRYQMKYLFDELFHNHILVVFGDGDDKRKG
jgi:hypothetical protein